MNKVVLMGRLVRDPEVKYTQGEKTTVIARYTLAVARRFKRQGEADADFINCVAFSKAGEFAEKYFRQGMKVCVSGRIQTGSYTNKDGVKVYTTDIVIEEQDFAESKSASGSAPQQEERPSYNDGFVTVPDGLVEELPFA